RTAHSGCHPQSVHRVGLSADGGCGVAAPGVGEVWPGADLCNSAEAAKAALHRDSERSTTSFDPMDEIDGSIIVLDVFDIDEYSLNPRKKANSQRAEIKASMKVDGITNMFSVTRRNPTEKYFPYGGGNTRVEIAKELVNEGVEKLRRIHVVTRKWPGEAAVIAAHLSENDNRSDISFWERAGFVA
ncbi:UNVERIFIED_CONTAM: hypothetical protein NO986_25355, partial [Comamonas sp. A-3]